MISRPDSKLLPERYGYNHLRLEGPTKTALEFKFQGELTGSANNPAQWSVKIVQQRNQEISYHDMPLTGTEGSLIIDDLSPTDVLTMSVLAWAEVDDIGENFAYQFQVGTPELEDSGTAPKDATCGCSGSSAMLLIPLFGWSRRRKS